MYKFFECFKYAVLTCLGIVIGMIGIEILFKLEEFIRCKMFFSILSRKK